MKYVVMVNMIVDDGAFGETYDWEYTGTEYDTKQEALDSKEFFRASRLDGSVAYAYIAEKE